MVHDSDRMPKDREGDREREKRLFAKYYTKCHLVAAFLFQNYNVNLLIQM